VDRTVVTIMLELAVKIAIILAAATIKLYVFVRKIL
jgi:hypothetical protein